MTSASRTTTVLRAAAAVLAVLLSVGPACSNDTTRSLTILHTNDLHARLTPDSHDRGGFARLAAEIRRESAASEGALALDAGDLVQGTPVSSIYRGVPVYEIANRVGIDVSIIGNHEFDYGWARVLDFRDAAAFPIVSANVVNDDGELLADASYVIREVNGVTLALTGVLTSSLPYLVAPDHIGPWRAEPVVETLRRLIPRIREPYDLLVVIAHITEKEEDAMLEGLPEVSVVISGHRHVGLSEPKRSATGLLVRVKSSGRELGRLDLDVDVGAKKIVSSSWRRIAIDASSPEADDVAERVAHWEAKVSDTVDLPIGKCARELSREQVSALVERVMAEASGADLAYLAPGEIRDILPAGRLLARHVWNLMPFEDTVVVVEARGSELPGDAADGIDIDPNRLYTLAVSDFTAVTHRTLRSKPARPLDGSPLLRDLIIDWIRGRGSVE